MHYWNGGIRKWFYTYLILATYTHFVYSTAIVNIPLIASYRPMLENNLENFFIATATFQ